MVTILLTFSIQKANIFLFRQEVYILQSTQEGYFDADYVMTADDGLHFEVALTGYDLDAQPIDESYAKIIFREIEWGLGDATDRQITRHEI